MTNRNRHLRTNRVLSELCSRISDQCSETGREDLHEVISILAEIARQSPDLLKAARKHLLACIDADDQLIAAAGLIEDHMERQRAFAEMETVGGVQ